MGRFLAILILVAGLVVGAYVAEQWNFNSPGPVARQGDETVILIKPGERSASIAERLADAGVIENPVLFRLGIRMRHQQSALKAGEYAIPSRASMADIMGILVAGRSIQYKVTAAEGLTSQMIYDIVASDRVLLGKPGPVPEEGSLLPETYLYTRGTTRSEILSRMHEAQAAFLRQNWSHRAANLPYKTQAEALTLASIVEKETALPGERRHIAGVFVNRLRMGMKLQSDPTIIYDITKGYPLGRGIRQSELERASPHNTYAIVGLPPTAICNPGKDAISAVLHPAATADLYFVANGTGGHVFASSITEHAKNVQKLRQLEKERR